MSANLPYDTHNTSGHPVTVYAVLPDGQLVATYDDPFFGLTPILLDADGDHADPSLSIETPAARARKAYEAMDPHKRDAMELFFQCNRKIMGVKFLRAELGLGLKEAKDLYEDMELAYNTGGRWAA